MEGNTGLPHTPEDTHKPLRVQRDAIKKITQYGKWIIKQKTKAQTWWCKNSGAGTFKGAQLLWTCNSCNFAKCFVEINKGHVVKAN